MRQFWQKSVISITVISSLSGWIIQAGAAVTLNVGDNFQNAVNANPDGTVFTIAPGIHVQQQVTPKSGNQFIGEDGAVMDGQRTRQFAFSSLAPDVVIRNIEIKNYTVENYYGAITNVRFTNFSSCTYQSGDNWTVENCDIHHNGWGGIAFGSRSKILNNNIHHQDVIGLKFGGTGSLVEGNEIAFCNTKGVDAGHEAGGSKFWCATDLVVRNNWVHDNNGPGLWCDWQNRNITYEGNIVENNAQMGIFHELSYDCTIRCNTVRDNAKGFSVQANWLYGSQIFISTSQNADVYHNSVFVSAQGGNGITIVNQCLGRPTARITGGARHNYVHHNEITHMGTQGVNGYESEQCADYASENNDNHFDSNSYHVPDLTAGYWKHSYMVRGWDDYRSKGEEAHGTIDTDIDADRRHEACEGSSTVAGFHESRRKSAANRSPLLRAGFSRENAAIVISGLAKGAYEARVFSANGELVRQFRDDAKAATMTIPMRECNAGIYIVRISANGSNASVRVCKP